METTTAKTARVTTTKNKQNIHSIFCRFMVWFGRNSAFESLENTGLERGHFVPRSLCLSRNEQGQHVPLVQIREKNAFLFGTTVLSHWKFSHGKFGLLFPEKASCDRVALPHLGCMLGVLCFHNPSNSDMDYGIFNVRTDVNAYDCARGCLDTVRESALEVDSGRKIRWRTQGNRTCVDSVPVRCCTN